MAGDVDDRVWKKLLAVASKLDKSSVRVGILASKGGSVKVPGSDFDMIALATVHEFGATIHIPARSDIKTRKTTGGYTVTVPERSFIRRTFEQKRDELAQVCGILAREVITKGMDPMRALAKLGAWGAAEVKKTITQGDGIPPPNAERTIREKGSDRPLVDTGRLVGSINYEVHEVDE